MSEPDYQQVWREFCALQQTGSIFGGYRSHASGPVPSYNLNVRVAADAVFAQVQPVQSATRGLPDIELHPQVQLHVTVMNVGGGPGLESASIVTEAELPALIEQCRSVFAATPPFILDLRNVNGFPTVLFIEAHDGGAIANLRAHLYRAIPSLPDDSFEFVPHMSICAFAAPTAVAPIVERVSRFRAYAVGSLRAERIELTSVPIDVATRNIFLSETKLAEFTLDGLGFVEGGWLTLRRGGGYTMLTFSSVHRTN
jgi:hypothetical protein